MGVYNQIIHQLTDQLVVMGLYFTPDATAVSNRIKGVPAGVPWNSQEWTAS